MSAAQHTPGPWAVEIMPSGRTTITAGQMFIAGDDNDYGVLDDNARLIAAAPDGLDAAQEALIALAAAPHSMTVQIASQKLRAFIAKATGSAA